MNWAGYIEKALTKLEKLFFKPRQNSGRRYCISINDREANLVCIQQNKKSVELVTLDSINYETKEDSFLAINSLFAKHNISSDPVYWLLNPNQYQMFIIDSLPKDLKELKSSLEWRVRNLINYPIEEAASDYFILPPNRESKGNTLVATSVAKRSYLLEVTDFFEENDINLVKIDIPEISMRNLTARVESYQKSTAFLFFYHATAILNITNQKQIYFTRHIDVSMQHKDDKEFFNHISLEILRLFDYFQSQWRLPSPHKLFIGGNTKKLESVAKKLSDNLLMSVDTYELDNHLFKNNAFGILVNDFIPEIGCALSELTAYENAIN